jgi:hypothetical protein
MTRESELEAFKAEVNAMNGTSEFVSFANDDDSRIVYRSPRTELVALATKLRHLASLLVTETVDDELLAELNEVLRRRDVEPSSGSRFPQPAERDPDGRWRFPIATHPVVGTANPHAPPMLLRRDGDTVIGEAVFDCTFEGWPNTVFGGCLASGVDVTTGFAATVAGRPGVTRKLSIQFLAPVPLNELVRFHARPTDEDARFAVTVMVRGETAAVADAFIHPTPRGAPRSTHGGVTA